MLRDLNPQQRRAVEHRDGPMLILAGAGSGKTRVVTRRIAHLIVDGGVDPERILAVTFTNEAADEMSERVERLLERHADVALHATPTISTFHSLGASILRRHGDPIGLDWNYTILDQDDQLELVDEVGQRAGVSRDHSDRKELRRFVERMKNAGLTPDEAKETTSDRGEEEAAAFYDRYQRALREANCADFGELLLGCVELFRAHPATARRLGDRWRYIMVDEFQDTNPAQYEFLDHLTDVHRNLAVVGDDDQAIYRWRDATVENILGFDDDYPDARVVKLEQNYRSTEEILAVAGEVVRDIPGRREKTLWTDRGSGPVPRVHTARDADREAAYVADEIERRHREGDAYADIAVFYRTNAQSRRFEEEFAAAGIPYRVVSGTEFFERREIKDVLAYLKLVLNPADDVALLRAIGRPTRGVGDVTIDKLRAVTSVPGVDSMFQAARLAAGMEGRVGVGMDRIETRASSPEDARALEEIDELGGRPRSGVEDFCELIVELRESIAGGRAVSEAVEALLDRTSYVDWIDERSDDREPDRAENVRELVRALEDFEERSRDEVGESPEAQSNSALAASETAGTLRAFLEQSTLVRDDERTSVGSVTLMTVHAAKGLEFETVFVVGMEDRLFPNVRDESHDPEKINEERRLAYVAFTRARDRLYLTNARRRQMYGRTRTTRPSRFLVDVDTDLLELDPRSCVDEIDYGRRRSSRGTFDTSSASWGDDRSGVESEDPFGEAVAQTLDREPEEQSQVPLSDEPTGTSGEEEELVGATVNHETLGVGEIVDVSRGMQGRRLTVEFPGAGRKTIYARHVRILG